MVLQQQNNIENEKFIKKKNLCSMEGWLLKHKE